MSEQPVNLDATIDQLELLLGYRFRDHELLLQALTHRSLAHERGDISHYERLEFLGDSVLGLVAAEWLFEELAGVSEGELAKLKSYLVSATALAAYARRLDLGRFLQLGAGEERSGGRRKTSLLADAVEALLGAAYREAGLEAARVVVVPMLASALGQYRRDRIADAKTELQERVQAGGGALPEYVLAESSGPDHQKRFIVECRVGGEVRGIGEGRSKKRAEQVAAAAAMAELDRQAREGGGEVASERVSE